MCWMLRKKFQAKSVIDNCGGWNALLAHGKFSIQKLYCKLLPTCDSVPWKRLIYQSRASPRSLFINWLHGRLYTCDKLLSWGMHVDPISVLCGAAPESINHLYFECDYAREVWDACLHVLHISRPIEPFGTEIKQACKMIQGKQAKHELYGMLFAEAVYAIWIQRNARKFQHNFTCSQVVFRQIVYHVACRFNGPCNLLLL
ncbi:uncharacterized protein LOC125493761 [Beta vulgaris subsp. vulgaris]|uniref:uncharacterized protein LOC125493761 n=1 Tax=Beta vulgaris subsp. vulgaris TaxID=3555 RepID=UPI002037551E|nr:uncharacterized protein LOC125493761 [Beta vulgaris subsp. vulgaris]